MDPSPPEKELTTDSDPPIIDFDFFFRPGYWAPANPLAIIVGNVVGEGRRRAIELSVWKWDSAGMGLLPEDREDFLSPERRDYLATLHSTFTGGEFLSPYLEGEMVEFLDSIHLHGESNGNPFVEKVLDFSENVGVEASTLGDFLKAEFHHYPEMGPRSALRVQAWLENVENREEDSMS